MPRVNENKKKVRGNGNIKTPFHPQNPPPEEPIHTKDHE